MPGNVLIPLCSPHRGAWSLRGNDTLGTPQYHPQIRPEPGRRGVKRSCQCLIIENWLATAVRRLLHPQSRALRQKSATIRTSVCAGGHIPGYRPDRTNHQASNGKPTSSSANDGATAALKITLASITLSLNKPATAMIAQREISVGRSLSSATHLVHLFGNENV